MAAAWGLTIVAYWPAAGAGFQSDDFRWLWHARLTGWADVARIFSETLGFYRPFTQLLWAVDLLRAGPDPTAFFVTNLVLHLLVLGLFAGLARRLLGDPAAAAAATLTAALSHHYNTMAVLWVSGRGASLGAAAALAALWLWDRWCREEGGVATWLGACAAMALGLGSYEAVAGVPLLMAAMLHYRARGARSWWSAAGPLALWVPYLWIRVAVGARQPWSSGQGYRYELVSMPANLLEYFGRAVMMSVFLITVIAIVALAAGLLGAAARAGMGSARAAGALGWWWFALGLLPALPVRNRSDLYVYFAALGLHLVAGAVLVGAGRAVWQRRPPAAAVGAAALAGLVLVAWPLFAWDRNGRIADQARLSMAAIADIRHALPAPRSGECVVLVDDRERRPDLHAAFSEDLFWLAAFVYAEPPSYRVRYAGDDRGEPCPSPHRLELAPGGGAVLRAPD